MCLYFDMEDKHEWLQQKVTGLAASSVGVGGYSRRQDTMRWNLPSAGADPSCYVFKPRA